MIPLTRPTLPPIDEILPLFRKIATSGQLTNNKFVEQFETEVSRFLGVSNSTAVSSGTEAIMIALLMIGKKGEVLIPSFDFSSPVHSLILLGFKPVLVDIEKETFNVDVSDFKNKITKDTVAICLPHIFGNPCDIEGVLAAAKEANIKVIFDSAHAFGSTHKGKSVANFGDYITFSFTPTKVLAIGEGGLLVCLDEQDNSESKILRNNGDTYARDKELIGLSARMTEWQAAIGLAALKHLDGYIEKRIKLVNTYKEALSDISSIKFQVVRSGDFSVYQSLAVLIEDDFGVSRDGLIGILKDNNIQSKAYFDPPIHRKVMYKNLSSDSLLSNTEYVSKRVICLPLFSHMDVKDVEIVTDIIRKAGRK